MNQEWDIQPRSRACSGCNAAFQNGASYFTSLYFEGGRYERADYCEGCWQGGARERPRHSAWRGCYETPPPPPPPALRGETAESLLRNLMAANDPANRNTIYILALMLERQRIFVERERHTGEDGRSLLVYEQRKTGETFVITDPRLRLADLEAVQAEVTARLGETAPREETAESAAKV